MVFQEKMEICLKYTDDSGFQIIIDEDLNVSEYLQSINNWNHKSCIKCQYWIYWFDIGLFFNNNIKVY